MLPLIPVAIAAFRAVRVVQLVSRLPAAMRAMSTLGRGAMRIGGQTLGRAGSSAGSVGGRALGAGGATAGGAAAAGGARGLATQALERVAIGSATGSSASSRDSPQSRTISSDSGSDNTENADISQSHILNETRNSPSNHPDTHSSRVDIDSLTRNYEVIGGLLNELLQNQNRNGGGGDRNNQSPIDIQPFIQELRESRIIAQRTLDQNREDAAAREARSAREEARESNERSEKKGYMSSLLTNMSKKTKSVISSATGEVKKLSLLDYAGLAALGYSMLKKYFADTYEKISSFLTSAVSILSDPIGFIQEKFSDMATAIAEKTKSVLGGIQDWYEQSDLKAFISDTFSTMTSMFDGLTSSITSLFKDWKLDEVWSKLTGWLDDVWGDTKKLASDAWSGTKSFFGFGYEDEVKKENRASTPLFAPAPTATQSKDMTDAAAIPPTNPSANVGPSPFADPLLHTGTIGAAAKSGGMKGLDPRLQEIMDETAKEFPLRSRVVSATGGRTGAHGEGRAMDIILFDQNGVALPNYQNSENFRAYEMFAQAAFLKAKEKYPDLTDGEGKNFNWGGYFGDNGNGKYKYGSNDSMHYALDDNEKFRASGAQAANPLQGLQGEYRGWYDKGDLLGGSKKYDPETFAADMEKLKNFRLTEEQAARAKASYYGVAKASGTLEKIPEDPTNPDVAFDFESLDKDMKSAPMFAATGDANSMADTNQILSDPSQMIAGFKPENLVMAQPIEPSAKKQSITKLPNSIKGLSHQEKFMKTVYEKAFKQTGDHETSLLLASQAAIETGYGKHAPNNNLFGVKSHGKSEGASLKTKEVINGKEVTQTANFREYKSYDEAIADRLKFTEENPRYRKNGYFDAQTAKEKAEALQRAGYATDPNYASKIDKVAEKLRKMGYDGGNNPSSNNQTTNQPSNNQTTMNQTTGGVPELSSGGVVAQSETETKSDKLTDFEYTGKNIMNVMSRGTSSRVPFIFDKIDKGVSSKLHDFSSDIGAGSNLVSNLTSSIQNKITEGLMGGTEELQKVMNSAQRIAGNVNVVTPQTNAPSNSQYNSGTTSVGAPLVTRNTDSSIRRLTDSLLSYGLT